VLLKELSGVSLEVLGISVYLEILLVVIAVLLHFLIILVCFKLILSPFPPTSVYLVYCPERAHFGVLSLILSNLVGRVRFVYVLSSINVGVACLSCKTWRKSGLTQVADDEFVGAELSRSRAPGAP
jgi:hypothetical protein